MAQRDINNFRSVIQQAAPNSPNYLNIAKEVGDNIIDASEQARSAENYSNLQLDINKLDQQIKLDYELKPTEGEKIFKEKRQALYAQYSENINPLYKFQWNKELQGVTAKTDALTQAWVYKQERVNTINSVNKAIDSSLNLATSNGMKFGESDDIAIESFLNFESSKGNIISSSKDSLGEVKANQLAKDFEGDYLKSFLSGVAETNPVKALKALDHPAIQDNFEDKGELIKFKNALENKALNFANRNRKQEVLNILKDENNLLSKSISNQLSYVDIQRGFAKNPNMSDAAKSYFLKLNGFGSTGKGGSNRVPNLDKVKYAETIEDTITQNEGKNLSPEDLNGMKDYIYKGVEEGKITNAKALSYLDQLKNPKAPKADKLAETEKLNFKESLYNEINYATHKEEIEAEDIQRLQNKVYEGLDNGSLKQAEALGYLNTLVTPLSEQMETDLENYGQSNWVRDNLGFQGVQDFYTQNIEIKAPEDKPLGPQSSYTNTKNKVELYDMYSQNLASVASEYRNDQFPDGVKIGDINKLNDAQKQKLYSEAQQLTKETYLKKKYPELNDLKDIPNQILKDGKLIQGMAGPRNINPSVSIDGGFTLLKKDGHLARKYKDGRIEVIY